MFCQLFSFLSLFLISYCIYSTLSSYSYLLPDILLFYSLWTFFQVQKYENLCSCVCTPCGRCFFKSFFCNCSMQALIATGIRFPSVFTMMFTSLVLIRLVLTYCYVKIITRVVITKHLDIQIWPILKKMFENVLRDCFYSKPIMVIALFKRVGEGMEMNFRC